MVVAEFAIAPGVALFVPVGRRRLEVALAAAANASMPLSLSPQAVPRRVQVTERASASLGLNALHGVSASTPTP